MSCGLLWIGLLVKLPALIRHWSEASLRAINGVLALASLCFPLRGTRFGAADQPGQRRAQPGRPADVRFDHRVQRGPAPHDRLLARRPSLRRTTLSAGPYGYTAVLALGSPSLFVLGDAGEERRSDFDTYYATTPWISEMVVLYLVAHVTAVTVGAVWSLRWGFEAEVRERPWLRASLLTIGAGTVISSGYSISKLIAVVARWTGRDWAVLGTSLPPLCAGLGAVLTVVGVLLPWSATTSRPGVTSSGWHRSMPYWIRFSPSVPCGSSAPARPSCGAPGAGAPSTTVSTRSRRSTTPRSTTPRWTRVGENR
ncbi:hypothetical protein LT493_02450 [Streptomyces tricolor]|nr:hypothetical protein [Streptomyces tricolor]